jgi:hypothetical protein
MNFVFLEKFYDFEVSWWIVWVSFSIFIVFSGHTG